MVAHQSGIWLEQQLMQSWISSFLLFPLKFTKFIWVSDYKSLFSWNKGCKVPISKKCQMFSKGPIKIQMATRQVLDQSLLTSLGYLLSKWESDANPWCPSTGLPHRSSKHFTLCVEKLETDTLCRVSYYSYFAKANRKCTNDTWTRLTQVSLCL